MIEIARQIMLYLSAGIEAIAALLIGLASIETAVRGLYLFVRFDSGTDFRKEEIRIRLGLWLSLALELELAADILRTAIAPSWDEIGKLASIVVLRTVLNYFLQNEVAKAYSRNPNVAAGLGGGVRRQPGSS